MLIRHHQLRLLAGLSNNTLRSSRATPILQSYWNQSNLYSSSTESFPQVARPSLWHSIVPKFLRKSDKPQATTKAPKSKEWNPATFYIIMFLLIGSNAIQMIALRNDFASFNRKADAKIGLLKDVLERLQKGEDVDVEGLLGTGNKEKEKEWEEVLREIEEEDRLWYSKDKKQSKPVTARMDSKESTSSTSTSIAEVSKDVDTVNDPDDASVEKLKRPPVAFY